MRAPILAFSVDDDPIAPKRRVQALHAMFTRTTVEQRNVVPRDLGAKAIGHLGFFLAAFKKSLWRDSLDWLRRRGG
jgi:predicted alpha/beta hydrolase